MLAAGAGSRFGGGKLLASLEGRPVLQHVLDRLAEAGLGEVVVVLGDDAAAIEEAIAWRASGGSGTPIPGAACRARSGSGSRRSTGGRWRAHRAGRPAAGVGRRDPGALDAAPDGRGPSSCRSTPGTTVATPCSSAAPAFGLVGGDRRPRPGPGDRGPPGARARGGGDVAANPDIDTRADLVALLEASWAARVRANAEQVDRFREVPDGTDFYAPVTGLFRADPTRTDEPALDALLRLVRPGERWLDIGAGAGRYALPLARALAPSGGG